MLIPMQSEYSIFHKTGYVQCFSPGREKT